MAIETNDRRLRSLQQDLLFPGYLFQGTLFPVKILPSGPSYNAFQFSKASCIPISLDFQAEIWNIYQNPFIG
jgi:hypothetical protein